METGTSRNGVPGGLVRASEWTWRLLIIAAGVLALCWALAQVFVVVVVVVVALLLTTFFEPPAARLRARGYSPAMATAISLTTGLLLITAVVALLVPTAADEFSK